MGEWGPHRRTPPQRRSATLSMYRLSLRSLSVLGTCAALLCGAPPILAADALESAVPDDAATLAQGRFEQALEAYKQGRVRAAIEHFKEADRLAPSARISFNIAKAYDRMDDVPNALAAYRDYLRRLPGAENAASTSLRISELELVLQRSGVQQVSVLTSPPGATVIVDGVSRGVTPWTGELQPGSHALSLQLSGHVDVERELVLPLRHAIDVVVELERRLVASVSVPLRVRASAPPPPVERVLRNPWPPATEASATPSWWTWTWFGGSAALLASAAAVELYRRNAESELAQAPDQIAAKHSYDVMQGRATAARFLLGMGLAAGVLGGVSLYLDLSQPSDTGEPALAVGCDLGTCGGFARGQW
jgi:tetratricopeptide (TPR) repeat protein